MKVYLDTGQLSELEILLNKNSSLAQDFFDKWSHYGCELALSQAHIQEIAQLGSEESVVNRVALLERFPVILYCGAGADAVADLEIRAQLVSKIYPAIYDAPPYHKISSELFSAMSMERLRKLIMQQRGGFQHNRNFIKYVTDMHTLASETLSHSKSRESRRQRRAKRKAAPMSIDIEKAKQLAKQSASRLFPHDPNKKFYEKYFTHIEMCYQKSKTEREALICIYELEGVTTIDKAPDADLSIIGVIFRIARDRSIPHLSMIAPYELLVSHMRHVDPYHAPGVSLRLAVERGRLRATTTTKPNDVVDADHLMCAPYVDIIFVDKRTFEFSNREAKSRPSLISAQGISKVRRSKSIEGILEEIAHVAR